MFKKPIQNLKIYKAVKRFSILFLTLIQVSFLFLSFLPVALPEAKADNRHCFYTNIITANNSLPGARPISSAAVSYPNKTTYTDGKSVTGFTAHLILDFAFDDTLYSSDVNVCTQEFADTFLYIGGEGIRNAASFYTDKLNWNPRIEQVSQNEKDANGKTITGVHIRLSGDVKVDNSNITSGSKSGMIAATDPSTYQSYFWFYPYSSGISYNKVPADSLSFVGCPNSTTLVCMILPGDSANPIAANDKLIPITKLKIFSRLNAADADFAIGTIGATDGQNFYRTYLEDDKKTIHPLNLTSKILPGAPPDKTLVINQNHTGSSQILFDQTPAIQPRTVFSIGAGFVKFNNLWTKSGDFGCSDNSLYSNQAGFTNDAQNLNFCEFEPSTKAETAQQVSVKMDGNNGYSKTVTFNNTSLAALMRDIIYLPTSSCTVDSCPESEATVNKLSYLPYLTIDPNQNTTLGGAIFPSFSAKWSQLSNNWYGLPLTFPSKPIYIEIYPSKAVWEKHKNDAIPAWVPKADDAGGSAQAAPSSVAQTLYAFIVRVISNIVVWLQSIIYRIFAYIVVPILKALLSVRPYKDVFVNIIYPGWLILRNLANIFFIISLLVVGLRILFQQSGSQATRGFIIRLVLMALLVNFSLVISQGIVAIADTVQSQFLPANSRVIEALGAKLMVEPLKNFNEEVDNKTSLTNITADSAQLSLADTIKPLVLLILSVASFFSFLAIAAFLLVRLVALWVLYMTSPIAYVGFVMGETSSYAKQWWKEFIRYVTITPILVFFLNIAALMAIAFSGSNNTLFKFNEDNSLSGDVVIGSLTILTHFIVLGVIYAGMKYASSAGGAAGKTIVKYAQKGFENTFKKPYQWGKAAAPGIKDFAGDKASTGMGKLFGSRAENITQALFKPKDALGNLKRGLLDRPAEDRQKREKKRLGTIDDQAYKIMNNKWLAAKYAASTLAGNGPKFAYGKGSAKADEAQILTDKERDASEAKLNTTNTDAAAASARKEDFHKGDVDVAEIDKSIGSVDALQAKLEEERDRLINDPNYGAGHEDVTKINDRLAKLKGVRDALVDAGNGAVNGKVNFRNFQDSIPDDLQIEASAVFDPVAINQAIDKAVKDSQAEKNRLEGLIKQDDERRAKYGYGDADPAAPGHRAMIIAERVRLSDEATKEMADAQKRFLPTSLSDRDGRLSGEREQAKKIEDIDDPDELSAQFESAMKKNNAGLATAIAKKMAKEGNFDKLLSANGYENNLQSFQAFMEKHFKDMAPQIRMQIASEVGHIAAQNGNTTFFKPTKVDQGTIRWSTQQEHEIARANKNESASSYDLAKKKIHEISYQRDGKSFLDKGAIDNFNSMNDQKIKKYVERKSPKELEDLQKFENYSLLMPRIQQYLESKRN